MVTFVDVAESLGTRLTSLFCGDRGGIYIDTGKRRANGRLGETKQIKRYQTDACSWSAATTMNQEDHPHLAFAGGGLGHALVMPMRVKIN